MLRTEIKAYKLLSQHAFPFIARYHFNLSLNGVNWMVIDYIKGTHLSSYRCEDTDVKVCLKRMKRVGITYGNVFGRNVIEKKDGSVVFIDFGRAEFRAASYDVKRWTVHVDQHRHW